jgi:hypothetical protein
MCQTIVGFVGEARRVAQTGRDSSIALEVNRNWIRRRAERGEAPLEAEKNQCCMRGPDAEITIKGRPTVFSSSKTISQVGSAAVSGFIASVGVIGRNVKDTRIKQK